MTETIDYAPLIPKEPPADLVGWVLRQGRLCKEYLIYKAGWEKGPEDGKCKQVAEVTCSACGRTFTAEKVDAGGCGHCMAPAPFGWRNVTDCGCKDVISGKVATCPYCGENTETVHVGSFNHCIEQCAWAAVVHRVAVPGKRDRLAISDWWVMRSIDKQGHSHFSTHLYSAWVVEEKKIVRLMGHSTLFWHEYLCELQQRKTFCDKFERYQELYPFDASVLEGTTAENSKLDLYVKSGGMWLVSYLALWRRHPNVENLIMQGCGKLVEDLIETERGRYLDHGGIPKLVDVDWKQRRPNLMLRMNLEEFRIFGRKLSANDYMVFSWLRENGLDVPGLAEIRLLTKTPDYSDLLPYTGQKDFWRAVRYLKKQNANVYTLRDYWNMAGKLEMDLDDSLVRWPRDLKTAHDKAVDRYNKLKAKITGRGFAERLKKLGRFAWTSGDLLIRPCASQEELKREGRELHHCVASYANRHAEGSTAILFIRKVAEPEKPFFTLELDELGLEVKQNRGLRNCERTKEVREFEEKWLAWVRAGCKRTAKNDPAKLPKKKPAEISAGAA